MYRIILIFAALLALGLIGCGGGTSPLPYSGQLVPAPPPPAPAAPAQTQPAPAPAVSAPAPPATTQAEAVVVELGAGSVARYRVRERLANLDAPSDAVGETPDVSGALVLDADGSVGGGEGSVISVDLRVLQSDKDKRDGFLRQNSLESNKFPTAEFAVREAPGLPWPLPDSGEASFQLVGDMTIHGTTRPLTWEVTAQFGPDSIAGQATTAFTFDDFGIEKPSLFFILSVADEIRLELDFAASSS